MLPLPAGWQDRSVVTLVETAAAVEGSASIVVTRDEVPPGTDAAQYAGWHETVLAREARRTLERLEQGEAVVGGLPAAVRTYRWSLGEQVMRQRMWCLARDRIGVCITASALDRRFDQLEPVFAAAVDGFTLDD
jgi:hypothetical protein